MEESFEEKTRRNFRVKARYDELMREGRHGHYETMFRVVREEVERERNEWDAAILLKQSLNKREPVK